MPYAVIVVSVYEITFTDILSIETVGCDVENGGMGCYTPEKQQLGDAASRYNMSNADRCGNPVELFRPVRGLRRQP